MFPDSSCQPKVMFPKNLLTTPTKTNTSSLTAYLTVPQHHLLTDCTDCIPGLISSSTSGENHTNRQNGLKLFETFSGLVISMNFFPLISAAFVNVGLKPVVAVSVLLYADGEQLQVRGAIQISLPLDPGMRLRAADTLPAWAFNLKTGKKLPHVVPKFFTSFTKCLSGFMKHNINKTS